MDKAAVDMTDQVAGRVIKCKGYAVADVPLCFEYASVAVEDVVEIDGLKALSLQIQELCNIMLKFVDGYHRDRRGAVGSQRIPCLPRARPEAPAQRRVLLGHAGRGSE